MAKSEQPESVSPDSLRQKLINCLANIRHDATMLQSGLTVREECIVVERIIGEATEGLKANASAAAEPVVAPRPPQPVICKNCDREIKPWNPPPGALAASKWVHVEGGHFCPVGPGECWMNKWAEPKAAASPLVVGQRPPQRCKHTRTVEESGGIRCLDCKDWWDGGMGGGSPLEREEEPETSEAEAVHPAPPAQEMHWSELPKYLSNAAERELMAQFISLANGDTRRLQTITALFLQARDYHFEYARLQPTLSPQELAELLADAGIGGLNGYKELANGICSIPGLAVVRKKGE